MGGTKPCRGLAHKRADHVVIQADPRPRKPALPFVIGKLDLQNTSRPPWRTTRGVQLQHQESLFDER